MACGIGGGGGKDGRAADAGKLRVSGIELDGIDGGGRRSKRSRELAKLVWLSSLSLELLLSRKASSWEAAANRDSS